MRVAKTFHRKENFLRAPPARVFLPGTALFKGWLGLLPK